MTINWDAYLESLCTKYAQWWQVYTFTDVVGQERVESQAAPLLFDFAQMVQTIRPKREQPEERQEKIERLGVLEALRKYAKDHVLLVGRPGSGKSTALLRLLLEEAQAGAEKAEKRKIPVLVELRYYQTSVLDLIRDFCKRHGLWLEISSIEQLLFEGRLLLLVDGINELPSEAARRDLKKFRDDNPKTAMIFTTRDLGVGGDLNIAEKLEMRPLTEAQMRQFVCKYLPQQGEQLWRQLGKRLQEFGQTPLLLMMLCSLFQATGEVPSNLGLVFRQFSQSYEQKLRQDVAVSDESRRWWQRLLEHLAFKMTQGENLTELRVAISRPEAEEILTKFLEAEKFDQPPNRAISWLQDLLNHHLIQLTASGDIEFRHQLIQEYYTAECLLKQLQNINNKNLKEKYLNYLKWTEPLVLMLELLTDEAQAVQVVELALEVDLKLGARLAGAVKPEFQKQTVERVINLEISQKLKIELLTITNSPQAINTLISALNHEDDSVRSSAADALGNIDNEAAVTALISALNHEDCYVRYSAAYALGNIGKEVAVTALISALNHEDCYVRYSAAEAIGNIGNEAAVAALVPALNHEDDLMRASAAEAIGNIGNEVAVTALISALSDEDSSGRDSVAEALGNIGNEVAVPALVSALNHEDYLVRDKAAYALGNIGNETAVPALIPVLNDENYSVRYSAAEALGKIGNEAAVPALISALKHEDDLMRASAADALENIGNEATVPALISALNDEFYLVREYAAKALGKIGNEGTVPALISALNDEHCYVHASVADALGNIGNEAAVTALISALNHEDDSVRDSAAYALGYIGNEAAVPALISVLNHEDDLVRSSAACALGNIGNKAAVPALISALNHKDYSVRDRAAEALGKIGNEATVPALVSALNQEYDLVCHRAAEALGKIGNEVAVTALISALNHKDYLVRDRAAEALGKIGNEAAVTALISALNHEDYLVRDRAAEALGNIGKSKFLPQLSELLQATGELYLLAIMTAIQNCYKFYNYELIPNPG